MRPVLVVLCALLAAPSWVLNARSRWIKDSLARYRAEAQVRGLAPDKITALTEAAVAQTKIATVYDSAYVKLAYPGGDVPAGRGVCSDVVVRAYRKLGVDLQVLVYEDMKKDFAAYPGMLRFSA